MSKVQLHAFTLAILLGLSVWGSRYVRPLTVVASPKTDFKKIPMLVGAYSGEDERFDPGIYKLLGSSSILLRHYQNGYDAPVELAIVYGTDLGDFHQPEFCLEGQGLRTVSKGKVFLKDGRGRPFEAVSLIMDADYQRSVFLFWFYSKGVTSTSLGNYKLKIFFERMQGKPTEPSAMVRLSTNVFGDEADAINRLVDFGNKILPYLEREFVATSQRYAPKR